MAAGRGLFDWATCMSPEANIHEMIVTRFVHMRWPHDAMRFIHIRGRTIMTCFIHMRGRTIMTRFIHIRGGVTSSGPEPEIETSGGREPEKSHHLAPTRAREIEKSGGLEREKSKNRAD